MRLVDPCRPAAVLPPAGLLSLDDLENEVLVALFADYQTNVTANVGFGLFGGPLAMSSQTSGKKPELGAELAFAAFSDLLANNALLPSANFSHENHANLAADNPFLLSFHQRRRCRWCSRFVGRVPCTEHC